MDNLSPGMYRRAQARRFFGSEMVAAMPLMAIEKFDALLDRHGPNLEKWPLTEQGQARELLKMSSAARTRLEEEQALTALLSARPAPRAPEGLAAKIVKKARESN